MEANLKEKYDCEVELIGSGGGIFDVRLGESLIFSKHEENDQFPDPETIYQRVDKKVTT